MNRKLAPVSLAPNLVPHSGGRTAYEIAQVDAAENGYTLGPITTRKRYAGETDWHNRDAGADMSCPVEWETGYCVWEKVRNGYQLADALAYFGGWDEVPESERIRLGILKREVDMTDYGSKDGWDDDYDDYDWS